jgi:hypothetical protein
VAFDVGAQAFDGELAGGLVGLEHGGVAQQALDACLSLLPARGGVEADPFDGGRERRGGRAQALRFRLCAQGIDLRHAAGRAFLGQAVRVVGRERCRGAGFAAARARLLHGCLGRPRFTGGGAVQGGDFLAQQSEARPDGSQPRGFFA